jgi:hypothetical protein
VILSHGLKEGARTGGRDHCRIHPQLILCVYTHSWYTQAP